MADTLRPIAVGVDGSQTSLKALDWAAGHAKLTGQPVEVLATWQWPTNYGYTMAFDTNYKPDELAEQVVDEAIAAVQEKHPDVDFRKRVVEGEPRNVLVARSEGVDLLVVGSRGHGELTGMLLGSVSTYCVTHATCPVLVIRT